MILDAARPDSIEKAAQIIKQGGVVGMPTETVYGLACDALNENAVRKVFEIKGRDTRDPLIVHVASSKDVTSIAEIDDPVTFKILSERFWPGPLTLVLRKKSIISNVVTANRATVAVRIPSHPTARALLRKTGPLAAPSANRFQGLSPTTAKAVRDELGDKVPIILDAGPCTVGVESTILLLHGGVKLLRPGGIPVEELEEILGRKIEMVAVAKFEKDIQAPGMMSFHYAPKKPLHVFRPHALRVHIDLDPSSVKDWALLCFSKEEALPFHDAGFKETVVLSAKGNLEEASRKFFTSLRRLDQGPCKKIAALLLPDQGLGRALNDRLQKAQHG